MSHTEDCAVLNRQNVEQTGKFCPETTAERATADLSREIFGKVVVVTGSAPNGLGAEAARVILLHSPKLLILASRNTRNIAETVEGISPSDTPENVKAVVLDLADLDSVRNAADEIVKTTPVVDVLINNAGVMMLPEFTKTKAGVETQFGVNHIRHFLLMNLLKPALLKSTSGPSVVNVTSSGHQSNGVRFDDINFGDGRTYELFVAYAQSKTANILFSIALTQRLAKKGLAVGTTGINRNIPLEVRIANGWWREDGSLNTDAIPWAPVEEGAAGYIVAGFDRSLAGQSGEFLKSSNIDPNTAAHALDPEAADKL